MRRCAPLATLPGTSEELQYATELLNPPILSRFCHTNESSQPEGKNQSSHLLKVKLATTFAAEFALQAATNLFVLKAPVPLSVGLPIMVVVLSHHGNAGSDVPPFHVLGAASRYFPPSLIPAAALIGVGET